MTLDIAAAAVHSLSPRFARKPGEVAPNLRLK